MARTRYKLDIARGKILDRYAEMAGLKRKFLESDKRLRKRILLAFGERI